MKAQPPESNTDVARIFAETEWLATHRDAPLSELEAHFGVQLLPSSGSNEWFAMREGHFEPGSRFVRIEMRRPGDPSRKEGLAILELAGAPCINEAQVRSHLGDAPKVMSNLGPHGGPGPHRQLSYFVYAKEWGELRASFTASGSCLADVVVDWTRAVQPTHRQPPR